MTAMATPRAFCVIENASAEPLAGSASMFYTPDYRLGMFTMNNDASAPMNPALWVKSSQPVFKKNSATASSPRTGRSSGWPTTAAQT
jgi:GH43 family beta-xylosidase